MVEYPFVNRGAATPTITLLISNGYTITGSRRVLTDEEIGNADYDFAHPDSQETVSWLLQNGFEEKMTPEIMKQYCDVATTSIWEKNELGVKIQVVLKKPELWVETFKLWNFLELNPNLFRQKFWKRGPMAGIPNDKFTVAKSADAIRVEITKRINYWYQEILPFM